jgi:hypothetical protein
MPDENPKLNPLPQHSKLQCQRFDYAIAAIIRGYPKQVLIDPKPLRPITYVARLRDAMNGYLAFRWPTEAFSVEQLEKIREDVVVTMNVDSQVVVYSKSNPHFKSAGEIVNSSMVSFEVRNPHLNVITSFCYLIHHGVWKNSVRFYDLTPEAIQMLTNYEGKLNVGVNIEGNSALIM